MKDNKYEWILIYTNNKSVRESVFARLAFETLWTNFGKIWYRCGIDVQFTIMKISFDILNKITKTNKQTKKSIYTNFKYTRANNNNNKKNTHLCLSLLR